LQPPFYCAIFLGLACDFVARFPSSRGIPDYHLSSTVFLTIQCSPLPPAKHNPVLGVEKRAMKQENQCCV